MEEHSTPFKAMSSSQFLRECSESADLLKQHYFPWRDATFQVSDHSMII